MAKLDQIELPNGVTYDFDDKYARKLTNNDFDTINVTELNAGDLIVTGVGRFTNGLYGNLIGNASTATLATTASKLSNTSKIGDTNKPVYFTASGLPSAVSYTLGAACEKGVDTTVTSGSSNLVTSGAVYTAIDNLPEPMVFKGTLGTGGTITSLPTAAAANEGFTYKVITAGTYASQTAKVGDVFVSNGSSWVLIPSGDRDSDTWRSIKVNGTEKLTSAISSGAVDFVNGTNTTVNFNTTGSKISINSVNTTYSLSASGESVVLSGSDNSSNSVSLSTLINGLTTGTSTPVDNDYYVSQYANGGTTTTSYHRRPMYALWNYVNTKASGVYVAKSDIPTVLGTKSYGVPTDQSSKKIKIKINPKNGWMLCFVVTLYQSYEATRIMISGYNYGTNHWYSPSARILGSTKNNITTYFGYDADYELWIGFDGAGYTGITIDSVTNGYQQITDYKDMFTISFVDELTTIQNTYVAYAPWRRNETVTNATNATNATSATTASKLGSANVGSATQPIYLSAGTATACTYTLGKSVPSDAVFTDTKNTAGSTDTSSKIYLIGATSQAANPQTYSDNEVFATSGVLTTKSVQVGGGSATIEYSATTKSINFVFAS